MANTLIITLVFYPDNVSTAHIMTGLAEGLKRKGNNVWVISTVPHYNPPMSFCSYNGYFLWPFVKKSVHKNINVFKIEMPKKTGNLLLRALAWSWFNFVALMTGILLFFKKIELIITPSPPLTNGLIAWILSALYRSKFIYNVQEIYPDIAIELGIIKNKYLIQASKFIEKVVYDKSTIITVISDNMKSNLIKKKVNSGKIKVIPNFVDLSEMQVYPKTNEFSIKYNIDNKFVVSYAGNIGIAQGLDIVIESAEKLRGREDIIFLFVGDGVSKGKLLREKEKRQLNNISFIPTQPYKLVPKIYASSDINLVPLSKDCKGSALPSKIYRIMACGKPILAIADDSSDIANVIKSLNCGVVVEPGNSEELTNQIIHIYSDLERWNAKGRLVRDYVIKNNSFESFIESYIKCIAYIMNDR